MTIENEFIEVGSDRKKLPKHFQAILAVVEHNIQREDLGAIKKRFERAAEIGNLGILGTFCIDTLSKMLDEKPIGLTEIISLGYLLLDIELKTEEIKKEPINDSNNQRSTRTH